MEKELLQLGAIAVIFLFFVKEFFAWLKSRKNGYSKKTYEEIALNGNNHLHEIKDKIDEQTKNNNEWHRKQYEVLCEIKGLLQKK